MPPSVIEVKYSARYRPSAPGSLLSFSSGDSFHSCGTDQRCRRRRHRRRRRRRRWKRKRKNQTKDAACRRFFAEPPAVDLGDSLTPAFLPGPCQAGFGLIEALLDD
jgi:hypothetical protein